MAPQVRALFLQDCLLAAQVFAQVFAQVMTLSHQALAGQVQGQHASDQTVWKRSTGCAVLPDAPEVPVPQPSKQTPPACRPISLWAASGYAQYAA